ncbi:hypothetical protein [Chiayiivirga flava]|uniref:Nuclear transport factor 2 family protein n=1 Tax=Chiayiivirga flava TaxID=659595 RepID=A0A7W8G1G8_9GAMM|nr:hypothetical protein [Chiayiivirga flava]MBB5208853.1 hypothetical protein [Chiayiivirga flava]
MRMLAMGTVALLLACGVQAKDSAYDAVVAAERAFAADAQARGVNAAFLAAAGEHGVVFRPGPLRVADAYAKAPPAAFNIAWGPAAAEVAPSGDLGYTYGPYEVTLADGKSAGFGHYFTVWERDGDGAFHFRSDIGISHAPVPLAGDAVVRRGSRAEGARALARRERDARLAALRELDSGLLPRLRRESPAAVYASVAADDLVLLRDGSLPLAAPFDDAVLAATDLGDATLMTAAERISADGTLATTYASPAEGRGPAWVRVWRRSGDTWQLAVDLTLPPPPEPADG